MGKLSTFLFIISGLTVLFWFTGIYDASHSSTLLGLLLNPENIQTSDFWKGQFGLFTATSAIGAAIVVGFFTKDLDKALATGVMTTIAGIAFEIITIMTTIAGTSVFGNVLKYLLFAPIIVILCIILIEWWRLKD